MNTISFDKKNVKMVAHRGVSGLEMENTLAAFVAAGQRTHYGIETDVHVTKDGQIAVFHDDNTKRVTGVDMIVEESTLEELQALRLYDRQEGTYRTDLRIPVLSEYIGICKKYEKEAVLELKNNMTPEDIEKIVNIIRNMEYLENVIFISFDWDNMINLRKIVPGQPAQFLDVKYDDELLSKLIENKLSLDIYHKAVTPELIETLHAHGLELNAWTVDDPADAARYAEWGIDYITSNILE